MYEGYLSFGCTEIANASRAYWQSQTADCPVSWLRLTYCDNLADALNGGVPYDVSNIADAPWFDPRQPETARFYGVYPLSIEGIADSSRVAQITEGILDGGTVSGYRHAVRTVRLRAILIARGQDALEAGLSWLDAALEPDSCGVHGNSCGEVDLQFFNSCPPLRQDGESIEDYDARVDRVVRVLHGVTCISGPTVEEKLRRDGPDGGPWAYIVEMIFACATPWVFSLPRPLSLPPTIPEVVQDIPFNLAPYPSAELAGANVVVATNYSANPSVETNTTGWVVTNTTNTGTAPTFSNARSTELAAVGVASFLSQAVAAAASTVTMQSYQDVAIPTSPAGLRLSASIWGAVILTGGGSIQSLDARVEWRTASAPISTVSLGTAAPSEYSGRVFAAKSLVPPAGAVTARVIMRASVTLANGVTAKMFADALAVTVP